ncbi:hypothetical protein LCGC14_2575980 [marine sediment metagenome]|uniref:Uncharacterized protein n=1 Tax=marine sediment metagenome TaxID=412755 RepID=A0A0F9AFW9_9ZZZZ
MDLKEIVKELENKMQCNCDLDSWQPERETGHSWVCRIHKAAKRIERGEK